MSARTNFFGWSAIGLGVLALAGGCMADDAALDDASAVSSAEQAVAQEIPGEAVVVSRRYLDPVVAKAAYAAPAVVSGAGSYCSAVMVGPNTLMTAAHCGFYDTIRIRFRAYRNTSTSQPVSEEYTCVSLLQSFSDTDLQLYHCPTLNGVNPGDKFGYLDFDRSAPRVGDKLFSVWSNPLGTRPDERFFSDGAISQTNVSDCGGGQPCWFAPDANPNIALSIDMYSEPGASGSPHVNPANGRIKVGSLSTGDGATRNALSMGDVLYWSAVSGLANVNSIRLGQLGLTGSRYVGYVDGDNDGLFDVETDYERLRGENARAWYWLGFESERRNKLWDTSGVAFTPATERARIRVTGAIDRTVLLHKRLNLAAFTPYRLSLAVRTNSMVAGASLAVGYVTNGVFHTSRLIPLTVGSVFQYQVIDLPTAGAGAQLAFRATGTLDVELQNLSLIKKNATNDFDSLDTRAGWQNGNTAGPAIILPDGNGGGIDWAGLVFRTASRPRGSDYSLRNFHLGFRKGHDYQVCFSHTLRTPSVTPPPGNFGVARLLNAGVEIARTAFRPGATWQRSCSSVIRIPTTAGSNPLSFGIDSDAGGNYFVDDVTVYELQ